MSYNNNLDPNMASEIADEQGQLSILEQAQALKNKLLQQKTSIANDLQHIQQSLMANKREYDNAKQGLLAKYNALKNTANAMNITNPDLAQLNENYTRSVANSFVNSQNLQAKIAAIQQMQHQAWLNSKAKQVEAERSIYQALQQQNNVERSLVNDARDLDTDERYSNQEFQQEAGQLLNQERQIPMYMQRQQ